MAKLYFNTAFAIGMVPDGTITVRTVGDEETAEYLRAGVVENVANPAHANTLDAVSRRLGVDVRAAKGGRVSLQSGDEVLVAEIGNVPRETREFTDAEIAAATFRFRLIKVR